jgi:uncharacterized protein DUF5990
VARLQIRIEGSDLPGRSCRPSPDVPDGYRNIYVGIQRRNRRDELLGRVPGDAPTAFWTLDCSVDLDRAAHDIAGPYIQGGRGGRFIYLSWVTVDPVGTATLFRRAKIWLDNGVPQQVLSRAAERGQLVGRLRLTDAKGNPLCASVRPPLIEWTPGA